MRKALVALVVTFTVSLAACASEDAGAPLSQFPDDAVIVDVRTPAEYATGHLEGALNIDLNAPDFRAKIAELEKDETYVLYCRSGNRSGQAKAIMEEMGFSDVTNAGGYDDLK